MYEKEEFLLIKSRLARTSLSAKADVFEFRVMRLATLAVMSLLRKRYDMIANVISSLAKPIITIRSIS